MQLCNKHTSNFPKWLYFPDDLHYSATRTLGKLKQSNLRIQEGSQERKKALFRFPQGSLTLSVLYVFGIRYVEYIEEYIRERHNRLASSS